MSKKIKNVVVAAFRDENEGTQAFADIKQSSKGDSYSVTAAALVKKEDGVCVPMEVFDTGAKTDSDTITGGLIGLVVGVIGGPIGMLFGAGIGSYLGVTHKASNELHAKSMIEYLADKLDDGRTAIIVFADEEVPDELDKRFSEYDTEIDRFKASDVAEEVKEAIKMEKTMAKQVKGQIEEATGVEMHK